MATLYISYFGNVDRGCAGTPLSAVTITTSGTSAATAANIPVTAKVACFRSDAAHYVTIGNGTPVAAAANSVYVPASETFWLRTYVAEGQSVKIAAITA